MLNNQHIQESELKALHADVVQWAMHCTGFDRELAREVMQQTYLKIVEGTARFNRKSTLKTWLFGVIRLTTLELKRKQRLHLVSLEPVEELAAGTGAADGEPRDHLVEAQIEKALGQLSLMQREVIYLAFYKDLSLSEIAQVLGVSVGTIRTQYHRAKTKLGNLLQTGEDNGQFFETSYS